MPPPGDDDPRWSLEMAGGALMDLGCYGLHVIRSLGRLGVPGIEGPPSRATPGPGRWATDATDLTPVRTFRGQRRD